MSGSAASVFRFRRVKTTTVGQYELVHLDSKLQQLDRRTSPSRVKTTTVGSPSRFKTATVGQDELVHLDSKLQQLDRTNYWTGRTSPSRFKFGSTHARPATGHERRSFDLLDLLDLRHSERDLSGLTARRHRSELAGREFTLAGRKFTIVGREFVLAGREFTLADRDFTLAGHEFTLVALAGCEFAFAGRPGYLPDPA
eukprot:1195356-Prorocentrum_minimum.AAC.9